MTIGLVVALLVAACGSGAGSTRPGVTPGGSGVRGASATAGPIPRLSHVYVIVMENKEENRIVGNPDAPFLNDLASRYGLATNYHAVAHPSQPNYLALFAGSTFGVADDGRHDLAGPTIADQLETAGRSWHVYAQNVPPPCFTGATAYGGPDLVGSGGWYARKHEPAISFTSISGDPASCAAVTPLRTFDPAAADFELIIPNLTNDMHDGTIAQGDAFLRAFVPRITGSPAFADSLLVITFDEGSTSAGGGGEVATVLASPLIPSGTSSAIEHDHYSVLRTVEQAWGLGCLAESCGANDLAEFFSR